MHRKQHGGYGDRAAYLAVLKFSCGRHQDRIRSRHEGPEKTRLIEFGRFAIKNRKTRGERKPESFNFLGFTHSCAQWAKGDFRLLRTTITKRLRTKLAEIREELLAQ